MDFSKFSIIFCLIFNKFTDSHPRNPQICTSDDCHRQAESLLSKIDTSVSPCDDFYQFACGNFDHQDSLQFEEMRNVRKRLKSIVSEEINENDDKPQKLVKSFYQSCLKDVKSLKKIVKNGLKIRKETKFSWEKAIQGLQFFQNSDAYIFTLTMDFVDGSLVLVVNQPRFDPKTGFLSMNSKKDQNFNANLVDFATELGIDCSEAEEMRTKAFEFEDRLQELVHDNSEAQIEISTIAELQEVFKFINWTIFMKNLFDGSDLIDKHFVLGIKNQKNLIKIDTFLFESSDDDIMNYLVWRFIKSAYIAINSPMEPTYLTKADTDPCLDLTVNHLDVALAAVYAKRYFDDQTKAELTDMVKIMNLTLLAQLESNDWLDMKTKTKAVEKLKKMEFYVGYTDEIVKDDFIADYYEFLDFNWLSFNEMAQAAYKNKRNKFLEIFSMSSVAEIRKNFITQLLTSSIFVVNAFYYPAMNFFIITAAFVSDQEYMSTRPMSMNFGAVGSTIGHEILHGFDSNGRFYDEDGIKNWWEKEAEIEFLNKSQCFIDQYGSFVEPITGLHVNGTLSLGENIADNGGIILAYNSYQKWLKIHKFDQTLPDVNFIQNQLFWIANAQNYCNNYDKKFIEENIRMDPHSPDRFRVLGPLSNSKEFLDDFKCSKGSGMNRKNKCKVW